MSIKEWMTRVMEKINTLSQPSAIRRVTLPFTPEANGLIFVIIRASATGRFYMLYNGATPNITDGYNTKDSYAQSTHWVVKGTEVSQRGSLNLNASSTEIYYLPKIGGVLKSPISKAFSHLKGVFA